MKNNSRNEYLKLSAKLAKSNEAEAASKLLAILLEENPEDIDANLLKRQIELSTTWHTIDAAFCAKNFQRVVELFEEDELASYNESDVFGIVGRSYFELGLYPKALFIYNRLYEEGRATVLDCSFLGLVQILTGDVDSGFDLCRSVYEANPENMLCIKNFAYANAHRGDLDAAKILYRDALTLANNDPVLYNNFGKLLIEEDLTEAISCFKNAILLNPLFDVAYANLGSCLIKRNFFHEAIICFTRALKINEGNLYALYGRGRAWERLGEYDKAIDAFLKAEEGGVNNPQIHYNLAKSYLSTQSYREALASIDRAIGHKQDYAQALHLRGVIHAELGDFDAAKKCFLDTMVADPFFLSVYRDYCDTQTMKFDDPVFSKMLELELELEHRGISEDRFHLFFALGKAMGDIGRYEESVRYFKRANAEKNSFLSFDIGAEREVFETLKETYDSQLIKVKRTSANSKNSPLPIFIVGMPRSGTTLTEAILASHSKIYGAGELPWVHELGRNIATGRVDVSSEAVEQFRESYLLKLQMQSANREFYVDKMPHNFRYLGLIKAAFPEARVIYLRRSRQAIAWSSFSKCFTGNNLGYSYNLDNLNDFLNIFESLMEFWLTRLEGFVCQVDYDELCRDTEKVTRSILNYVGVEFEDVCLRPEKRSGGVKTASKFSVRQKIYQGSSDAWRKYAKFLDHPIFREPD